MRLTVRGACCLTRRPSPSIRPKGCTLEPLPDLGSLSDEELKQLIDELEARGARGLATSAASCTARSTSCAPSSSRACSSPGGKSVLERGRRRQADGRSSPAKGAAGRPDEEPTPARGREPRLLPGVRLPEPGGRELLLAVRRAARARATRPSRRRRPSRPRRSRTTAQHDARRVGARGPGARRPLRRRPGGGDASCRRASARAIGRSPDCEIFLDDVTVSRNHAVLVERDGALLDRGRGQPQRHVRQPPAHRHGRARERRRAPDRQVPADLPRAMSADRGTTRARERLLTIGDGRAAACATSSRTSRSRRSATSRTRACSRRGARRAATGCSARTTSSGSRRSCGSSATSSCRCA